MDNDKAAAFLRDLTALTRKHKIRIDGCGGCDSPYLADLDKEYMGYQYSVLGHYGMLMWADMELIEEFHRFTFRD